MELHTGGLGSSVHLSEDPLNACELNQEGLLLSSISLEKSSVKMLNLWQDIFEGVFVPSDKSHETSLMGLRERLNHLISMSAVESTNGLAYMGHHYAMAHAASKLRNLPALQKRENLSGISMVSIVHFAYISTVWKLQGFSVTKILCEIKVGYFKGPKKLTF